MKAPINIVKTNTQLLKEINSEIAMLEKSIAKALQGNLIQKKYRGKMHYCRQIQGCPIEYLGCNKEELLAELAQKKYDEGVLKVRYYEKSLLLGFIDRCNKKKSYPTIEQYWASFPEELKKYVSLGSSTTNEGFIQQWKNNTSNMKNKEPLGNYYTLLGEHVRSKSEVIIADRLHNAGLNYYYELAYSPNMGADFCFPDFTILHPSTYEQWYWEHFGKMDDNQYSFSAMEKLRLFSIDGIYPGKNLIITFETSKEQLDVRYVDDLINTFFKS